MKYKLLLLLLLLLSSLPAFPQSEHVKKLLNDAFALMDNKDYDASISKLEEALTLDPKNPTIHYEIGLAYYLKGDYNKALQTTQKVLKYKNVFDQIYQLRGNSYDMLGNRDVAIKTYEEGLKKFPNSGALYLESGIVMLKAGQKDKALTYFERGIAAAPQHSSNYYWASKLFLESDEEVWGMLYGEVFRLLEPNSERSTEISKLLYDTYKREINYTSDTTISVSFSKNNIIGYSQKRHSFSLPFGAVVYEPILAASVAGTKQIDLTSLHQIRSSFIQNFYNKDDLSQRFDNTIFKWHQKLLNQAQFEAYNYWLLSAGNPDEFDEWMGQNKQKFDAFIDWYNQTDSPISKTAYFHRSQFDNITLTAGE